MSDVLEKIRVEAGMFKDELAVLPRNNLRNATKYLKRVDEMQEEFTEYSNKILDEIKLRFEKIDGIKESKSIKALEGRLNITKEEIRLLNHVNSSYEKMELDKIIFDIGRFYRKNLEKVNKDILAFLSKFDKLGIKLTLDDFNYSIFVREYMKVFFEEIEKGDITSNIMKNTFESIFWKCSDLITHIELNLRHIYREKQKDIEKCIEKQTEDLFAKYHADEERILRMYNLYNKKLIEKKNKNSYILLHKFYDGKLDLKNFTESEIMKKYTKFVPESVISNANRKQRKEIDQTIQKLYNRLHEYQVYIDYQFLIDAIKKIYLDKEKNKDVYETKLKEILAAEKVLENLNKKYEKLEKTNGKGIFKKADNTQKLDALTLEINNQIVKLKVLYRELDDNKIKNEIASKINDNSTLYDVLYFAYSHHNYLFMCIVKSFSDIEDDEIKEKIEKLEEFMEWPYTTILNHVKISEGKNIGLIIKDRYKMSNLNLNQEDLDSDSVSSLFEIVNDLVNNCNIKKSRITIADIKYVFDVKGLL